MSRLKLAVMWAYTIGASVFGLLVIVGSSQTDSQIVGAVSLVLLGGSGAVYLRLAHARPPAVPVLEVGHTDLLGRSEVGLVIPVRPPLHPGFAYAVMLVAAIVFIGWGVVGGRVGPFVVGVAFAALFAVTVSHHVRRHRTPKRVVLTAGGLVYDHPVASLGVRWEDTPGVMLLAPGDTLALGVLAPPEAVVRRAGPRRLLRLEQKLSGTAISIPTSGLMADPDRLIAALNAYARDPSPLRDPERERPALAHRLTTKGLP